MNDLVCEIDGDRRFIYVSPSFESQLGIPAELVGMDAADLIHPDDRRSSHRRRRAPRGGCLPLQAQERRWRWFESTGNAYSEPEAGGVVVSVISPNASASKTLSVRVRTASAACSRTGPWAWPWSAPTSHHQGQQRHVPHAGYSDQELMSRPRSLLRIPMTSTKL
jgi:PAS domain S-box-containing protein